MASAGTQHHARPVVSSDICFIIDEIADMIATRDDIAFMIHFGEHKCIFSLSSFWSTGDYE